MNKKYRISLLFMLSFFIFCISNNVFAATSKPLQKWDGSNLGIEYSYNGETEHAYNKYGLNNESIVFCIEPDKLYSGNVEYTAVGSYNLSDEILCEINYIANRTDINGQIRQAAIWVLLHGEGGLNNTDSRQSVIDLVNTTKSLYRDGSVIVGETSGQASLSGNLSFDYDNSIGAYASSEITLNVTSGSANVTYSGPNGTYLLINGSRGGNGSYGNGTKIRVIVPKDSFDSRANVVINATTPQTSQTKYGKAKVYVATATMLSGRLYDQNVIAATPGVSSSSPGSSVSVSGTVKQTWLKILKKDQHGSGVSNCTFHITGTNFDQTVTTSNDGTYTIKGIQSGNYTIEETNVSGNLYIDTNNSRKTLTISDPNTREDNTITFEQINNYVRGSVGISKSLISPISKGWLGDSNCDGIEYTLFAAQDIYDGATKIYSKDEQVIPKPELGCPDANGTITFDASGSRKVVSTLPVGNYYFKETKANDSTELDSNTYSVTISKSKDITSSSASTEELNLSDQVKKYNIEIIKYREQDSADQEPAEGAVLRLTLDRDNNQTYTATVNKYGYASFTDIAWGEYTLSEDTSNSNYHLEIQNENITLKDSNPNIENINNVKTTYKIIGDEKVRDYLKVQKMDADINEVVALPGTKFKIYDVNNKKFVELPISNDWVDEFETDSNGIFITPQKLDAGEYRIYETQAPNGYYLNNELAIPTDESKIGTEGGVHVTIDKFTNVTVLEDNRGLMHTESVADKPLVTKLEIVKKGEMVTGVNQTTEEDINGNDFTVNTLTYENMGLEGAQFQIITAEDIKTPDGRYTYPGFEKGKVVDTITTDKDGIATTLELYPGKYIIKEIKTPYGYIPEDEQEVTLENTSKTQRVTLENKEIDNKKQNVKVLMKKLFDTGNYEINLDNAKASLGIYTAQDIVDSEGKIILRKDSMIGLANCELTKEQIEKGEAANVDKIVNIPEGEYYIKEVAVSDPFEMDEEEHEFSVKFDDNNNEPYSVTLDDLITNVYPQVESLRLYKISDSSLINAANGVFTGTSVKDITTLDDGELSKTDKSNKKVISDLVEKYIGQKTKEEIEAILKEQNINVLSGAQYKVYLDKECTKPLHRTIDGTREEAILTTNENGYAEINNVPQGTYYLKEIVAPKHINSQGSEISYELNESPIEVILTNEEVKNNLALRIATDSIVTYQFTKKDEFNGETIPNCTFEVLDENNDIIVHDITDSNGIGYIPYDKLENGKTYYLKEISAPNIYDISDELHEFVASYEVTADGRVIWTGDKIEVNNKRKNSTVTLEKLDMVTSTPIPNCKFELKSLETDYVVTGVTDKDGHYVFENVPYGKYTYTELEAPKDYMIDTTPHEIEINDEEIKIKVRDEKATNTGDIAVIALSIVAVISIAGIVYVFLKNKKKNNKNT